MKAKELRLGNYIIANGSIEKINYITPATLGYGEKEFAPICTSDYKYFEPIPLTEECLSGFGFGKTTTNYFELKLDNGFFLGAYILWQNDSGEYEVIFTDESNNELIVVKYVHQLQNLYFALTNQELKLK